MNGDTGLELKNRSGLEKTFGSLIPVDKMRTRKVKRGPRGYAMV